MAAFPTGGDQLGQFDSPPCDTRKRAAKVVGIGGRRTIWPDFTMETCTVRTSH